MTPAPAPTLPPLHPSMVTPQLSPPSPFPNTNLLQAHYARGGHVEGLQEAAEDLRGYGRHGDTVLAHISPAEALMLRAMGGSGTINPHTGLPEYFLGGVWKSIKRYVGPVIGSIAGTILGGPVGGAIGGAIGGSFGHPNNRIGPLKGGAMGFFAGPTLMGGGAGLMNGGMGGMLSGAGQGFGSSMGMLGSGLSSLIGGGPGAGTMGVMGGLSRLTGMGMPGAAATVAPAAAAAPAAAGGGGLLSALGGGGGLLNTALLGTAILGTLGRRETIPDQGGPVSLSDAIAQAQPQWRPEQYPRRLRPYRNRYRPLPRDYNPAYQGEHRFFEPEEEEEEDHRYRGGYIDDATGGQDDKVKASLSGGEFVIPSDVVSSMGDGNNRAGAEKFYALMRNVRHHQGRSSGLPPRARPIASYLH